MYGKTLAEKLNEAREDLLEKVSIAGWKEALGEKVRGIRITFLVALLFMTGCTFFYIRETVEQYRHSGYRDEITDITDPESMPFSNVTICAQVYLNETYVRNTITMPDSMAQKYLQESGHTIDELYKTLTLYLSLVTRPRMFSGAFMKYIWKLVDITPAVHQYATFLQAALPPCQSILKRCWFNGVEFDCCEHAMQAISDDGICYQLMVSI